MKTNSKTKTAIFLGALALASIPAYAAEPQAQGGMPVPTMNFTSIPIMEKVGAGAHKVYPYRNEDKMIVIIVDPIACGQKPVNPHFDIKGDQLVLRYDLTNPAAAAKGAACTAHSTFEINNVPHRDLAVSFAGGKEPFVIASLVRCPDTAPVVDVWDCMVPRK